MFRIASAAVLLGSLSASAPAAPPGPLVFRGVIRDVLGTEGRLMLTLGDGLQARDRMFDIQQARIKGPTGAEWKVGDLHDGDRVEVEMTASGRMVRVIRVLPGQ